MCIESDHGTTNMWCRLSTFMGCNYRLLKEQDTELAIKLVLKSGSEKMLRQLIIKGSTTFIGAVFTLWFMENDRIFAFTDERCQKYASHQKELLIKIFRN